MTRGRVFWASLFLLVGTLLLLNNLGLLPFPLGSVFWPSLLVLFGVWLIARGFVAGSAPQVERSTLPREGAESAKLTLEHAAGRLSIGSGTARDELLGGHFAGGVSSTIRRQGSEARIKLAVPAGRWFDLPFGGNGGLEWSMELSPDLVYELEIRAAAGETNLLLADLKVIALHLQTGASSSLVELPAMVERGQIAVEAGVASVELHVPPGVGARITSEAGLAEVDVDRTRFPRANGAYQSTDFQSADKRLEIDIQAGVGSVKVR